MQTRLDAKIAVNTSVVQSLARQLQRATDQDRVARLTAEIAKRETKVIERIRISRQYGGAERVLIATAS